MIIKDLQILKAIARKYNLSFCPIHRYYEGDANKNDKGDYLPTYFKHNNKVFKLQYFDGCFNPFLVICSGQFAYCVKTKEPIFKVENWNTIDRTK